MLLTVAFGHLEKAIPRNPPFELQYELADCCMPRDGNEGMVNLLGLGEGYWVEFKYLVEDSLESSRE